MANNYVILNNFNSTGKVGISRAAIETIASKAVNEVKEASVAKSRQGLFKVKGPASVAFRKDGRVDIRLEVTISKDAKVKDVCLEIQESVASAVTMMCETVPFSIKIKVVGLI